MDTAAEALLIIVSAVLSVFLIIFTIALIYLVRIFKKANRVADSVESAADAMRKGATAAPFVRFFQTVLNKKGKKR